MSYFCVLRNEHFSIGRLVRLFVDSPAAAVIQAATSYPNIYWLKDVVGPVAQLFGGGASASRTFSAITDLIAVAHREVDRLCQFSSTCVHAPPPPA